MNQSMIKAEYFTPCYSLSHLTLLDCSIAELTFIASRAGYDAISPRLITMGVTGECHAEPLAQSMIQAARNALQFTGVTVHDIELARITDDCNISSYEPAIALGAELGARQLVASAWNKSMGASNYTVDCYAQLCQLAAQYNMQVALEFPCFSSLPTLADAQQVVSQSNASNGSILIDTLYTQFAQTPLSEIAALPRQWLNFIQVSDIWPGIPSTREQMTYIAREARLYPGEGCIDFSRLIAATGPVDIAIELPNRSQLNELGLEQHARKCLTSTKQVINHALKQLPRSIHNIANTSTQSEEHHALQAI